MREGPNHEDRFQCHGCSYLHTEDWEFHEENDGIDRGTDATCNKVGKSLGSYWQKFHPTPSWCPYLKAEGRTPPSGGVIHE